MGTNTIRTQVVLNKEIVEQALQITHLKSKRELLDYALRELIRRETQKKLLELKAKLGPVELIFYSAKVKKGRHQLLEKIFSYL